MFLCCIFMVLFNCVILIDSMQLLLFELYFLCFYSTVFAGSGTTGENEHSNLIQFFFHG